MGLRSYVNALFSFNPEAQEGYRLIYDGSKWILDFIRNLIVVGILVFFEKKTHNKAIMWVAIFGFMALVVQLWIPLLRYNFRPFHFVQREMLRDGLNALAHLVFVVLALAALYNLLIHVVHEVADIQGLR